MELHSAEKELKDHLGLFFDSLKMGDIVLLSADLGMGKTTLVRNFVEDRFAKAKESKSDLHAVQFSSPSYNLIQEYKLKNYTIYHIDLYRLEDEDQIASVGLWDVLDDPESIIFIEWAERIKSEDLPSRPTYEIKITLKEDSDDTFLDDSRQYTITKINHSL